MELNTIVNIFLTVLGLWLAYRAGQLSILIPLQRVLAKIAASRGQTLDQLLEDHKTLDQDSDESAKSQETVLEIERHGDRYYIYEKEGQFMAQGEDFEQAFTEVKRRFPNRNFRINRTPEGLTDEEAGRMMQSIFQVFGSSK